MMETRSLRSGSTSQRRNIRRGSLSDGNANSSEVSLVCVSSNKPPCKRKLTNSTSSLESASSVVRKHTRRTPHDPDSPPFDWQSKKRRLKDRTAYIFDRELYCDVHFVVGQGQHSQRIPAHKFMLSIGSAVFDVMFSGDWSSESDDIKVPDVEPAAFSALLRYLYTDEVTLTADTVMAILYAAKKYGVPSLENMCLNFLLSSLRTENAFSLLSQALAFDEQDLVKSCLEKIDSNAVEAFSSDCFTDIELESLCRVLERDTLKIREIQLFEAVCRWSRVELSRKNLPESPENQRSVLQRVLPLIRYPLMTAEQISSTVTPSGLLSDKDLVSLYSYLTLNPKPPTNFNCTPRGPKRRMGAHRFETTDTEGSWTYVEGVPDTIGFCSDRDIFMEGYTLYGPVDGQATYLIATALVDTLTGNVLYEESGNFKMDGSRTMYRYIFTHPVKLAACINYTLRINIEGPRSYYGMGGLSDVTVDLKYGGQVTISFNTTDDMEESDDTTSVERGQIPEILFRL